MTLMLKNIESKKFRNFLTTLEKLQEVKPQHVVFHIINSYNNKNLFSFLVNPLAPNLGGIKNNYKL